MATFTAAAPIFAGDSIVAGSYNGSRDTVQTLSSWNRKTGEANWSKEGNGAFWFPQYRDGVIYTGSTDHKLYAFDARTGQEKWSYETTAPLATQLALSATIIYCSTQGRIYQSPAVPRTIYAIDIESGQYLWSYDNRRKWLPELFQQSKMFHSPVFFKDKLYASAGSELWVFDAKTGKKLLVKDLKLKYFLQPFHLQCINEDYLCLSSTHANEIIIVHPENGEPIIRINASSYAIALHQSSLYWSDQDGRFHAFDLEDSTEKWVLEFPEKMFGSPIVQGTKLYTSLNETLYCLDSETGELLWSYSLSSEQKESE